MNHHNGLHSERNDPSLSARCAASAVLIEIRCVSVGCIRTHRLFPVIMAPAHILAGGWRDRLHMVTLLTAGSWRGINACSLKVVSGVGKALTPVPCCFAVHTFPVSTRASFLLCGAFSSVGKPTGIPDLSLGREWWIMPIMDREVP